MCKGQLLLELDKLASLLITIFALRYTFVKKYSFQSKI